MKGNHAVLISNSEEARYYLSRIGIDDAAYQYLLPKAVHRCMLLKNISARAASIIKQEMLAKGGEAAVSKETLLGEGYTDVLLMGTIRQYSLLLEKLKLQPFGLKQVAQEIKAIINALEPQKRIMKLPHGKEMELGKKTLIMGILNVTPDSFSDGGRFEKPEQALSRALEMKENGADIIDIGGASSRPNSVMVDEKQELQRVLPVVEKLAREELIISIDTYRANVARACLETGAHIINDIGRLQLDPGLLPVLVENQAPVILMHNRMQFNQEIPYQDLLADIISELSDSVGQAIEAGLGSDKIIIDPGVGFGKTVAENRVIIKRLADFKSLGRPVLLGVSRKSFIGQTLDLETDQRLEGSLAVLAMGIMSGADIIRVHDVKESKRAADMIDAIRHENG